MIKASSIGRRRISGKEFGGRVNCAATRFILVLLLPVLTSCVSVSPPGDVIRLSVSEVQQGAIDTGVPLRWGGTITTVHNKPSVTLLEIVSRPLLRTGRPRHNDQSDGRFLAEVSGFLDPEIVKPGRDISVIGTFNRMQSGQVGEAQYRYPVIAVFDYRFWKKASEIGPNSGYPHFFRRTQFGLIGPRVDGRIGMKARYGTSSYTRFFAHKR